MSARLDLRLTGGAVNANPALSLGGLTSAHPAPEALFADLSAGACGRGGVDYRAVDFVNVGDQGAHEVRVWTETPNGAGSGVALGLSGVPDVGLVVPGQPPWDHGAPVTFAEYSAAAPLTIPLVMPGQAARLWLRRTTPRRAALGDPSALLRWTYL